MCIGEGAGDTLHASEASFLQHAAASEFPAYACAVHSNGSGMSWVVLDPSFASPALLKFTICRIDPCVMVMVEDRDARREFCSTSSVEDAVAFMRHSMDQAMLAVVNTHPASPVLQ
jgi:hypothetical protein